MANRISVLIDVATTQANKKLGGFRAEVSKAEGAFGKLKAGASVAFDSIKQNAGLLGVAAGTAIARFAIGAVDDFKKGAIAAGEFASATGLSIEEASKWSSYADDLELSAATVEKAFLKLNDQLGRGNAIAEEYGIRTVENDEGLVDINETMLSAIDIIGKIEDPTKRAMVAQQLFGRSYGEVSRILLSDADSVRKGLESTSEAQIFDEEEYGKAQELVRQTDLLNDRLVDVKNTIGGYLIPQFSSLLQYMGAIYDTAKDIDGAFDGWLFRFAQPLLDPLGSLQGKLERAKEVFAGDDITGPLSMMAGATIVALDEMGESAGEAADDLTDVGDEADYARRQLYDLTDQFADLKAEIADQNAYLNAIDSLDDLREAGQRAWDKNKTGAEDAEAELRDYQRKVNDAKLEVIDLVEQLGNVPAETTAEIIANITEGALEEAEEKLTNLTRSRTVDLAFGVPANQVPYTVAAPNRQQLGTSTPARGSSVTNIYNVPTGVTPRSVTQAGNDYTRTQGPL